MDTLLYTLTMKNIGKKLKQIRLSLGLSQEEMAKRLGYANRSAINKIETGLRGISYNKLLILIRDFNLDIEDLKDDPIKKEQAKFKSKKPDPNMVHPIIGYENEIYVKPTITNPNILVGDFTYIADKEFESHVTHLYEWNNDKLIIGKFCQIGSGVEFIMNGANHQMNCASTYPFYTLHGWNQKAPRKEDLPSKGDTVIGNDVWIGQNAVIMPGVHVGDGAIIGCNSVVSKDVEPYTIVAGNPIRVIRKRFDDELIDLLEKCQWWDKTVDEIQEMIQALTDSDFERVKLFLKRSIKKEWF